MHRFRDSANVPYQCYRIGFDNYYLFSWLHCDKVDHPSVRSASGRPGVYASGGCVSQDHGGGLCLN